MKYYLHDAVYLYLLTVNQTLAEGNLDYRDGHVIINRTIGQRFVGKHSVDLLADENKFHGGAKKYRIGSIGSTNDSY